MVVIDQRTTFTGAYAVDAHPHDGGRQSIGPPKRKFAIWLATHITAWVGTFTFFVVVVGGTLVWLLWNTFAPKLWRFDPAPAYVMWLFISNLLQLTLLPLLMISQNHQTRHSEERAADEYQRIGEILVVVESLRALTEQIALNAALNAALEERLQAIEDRARVDSQDIQILRRQEADERLRRQQARRATNDAAAPLPLR